MNHPVLSPAELCARACAAKPPLGRLSPAAVSRQVSVLTHWGEKDGAIERAYKFADYFETIAFVNALAYLTHIEDHHPDLLVSYNRCTVRYSTHSVGGISENDFICAAKCDALFALRTRSAA